MSNNVQDLEIARSVYEAIPAGVYPAVIADIVPESGQYGDQLKFKFHLDPFEGYDSGKDLHAWASTKFNPKTKLYRWAKAAIGDSVQTAAALKIGGMLNKRVLVVISHVEKDGTSFEHVDNVLPVQKSRTAAQVNADLASVDVVSPF